MPLSPRAVGMAAAATTVLIWVSFIVIATLIAGLALVTLGIVIGVQRTRSPPRIMSL